MKLIGLMSGTSVDSIDAASVEIDERNGNITVSLCAYVEYPWPEGLRAAIHSLFTPHARISELSSMNFLIGEQFALAATAAAEAANWSLADVAAIASHGQTIWHAPRGSQSDRLFTPNTLQIGEPSVIAARTGCKVIADFRTADVAAGGQGAPLVPYDDYILFRDEAIKRGGIAIQNIGGIGNVTFLPRTGRFDDLIAFDTGPGNMILDGLAQIISCGAQSCDRDGSLSDKGAVCHSLLQEWMDNPFFSMRPPKSTGREMFGAQAVQQFYKMAKARNISDADTMMTAVALTVESIVTSYRRFLYPFAELASVVVGGGGAHNPTIMRSLRTALQPVAVTTHAAYGINDDAKEAIAFALLGYATLQGRPSNVPSATGASRSVVLGKIALPTPLRA